MNSKIEIVDYRPEYKDDFVRLNSDWISEYFKIEEADIKIFAAPDEYIIKSGGFIFCALLDGKVVGVCALMKMENNPTYGYELAKLAVDKSARGLGLGEKLCRAAIAKAKSLSKKQIYIESNTRLKPAIALYKKLGFREIKDGKPIFERVDIQLAL